MTPSELKYNYQVNNEDGHFFDPKTLRFFGDTMHNFRVRAVDLDGSPVWELYRHRPVKHGLNSSYYFDKVTFKQVRPALKGA